MKKVLLILGLCIAINTLSYQAQAQDVDSDNQPCEVSIIEEGHYDYAKPLLQKIKMQRDSIYNALNLTPSQIKCKNEIDKKRYEELLPELQKLCQLNRKVKAAGEKGDMAGVKAVQKEFKPVKASMKKICEKYDKEFMKILNSNQKEKYRMIRKLKRSDLKKMQRIQKNGRKPSDVKPFGEKISQPAYTEMRHNETCLWHKMINKMKKSE